MAGPWSDVMDDIGGSGSPVRAVRGRVFRDGRTARRGGRRTTARGDAGTEEAEHFSLSLVVGVFVGFFLSEPG